MAREHINRITLFKIPDTEDQIKLLNIYREMPLKAMKVSRYNARLNPQVSHDYSVPPPLILPPLQRQACRHATCINDKPFQDGKPYILSVTAGTAKPDQRAQGFTVAVISVFGSAQDMVYYDNECAAHAELKAFAKTVHQGAMMVFFENEM